MSWTPNARTVKVLATVQPKMREKMLVLLEAMAKRGMPMTATDGNRTAEQQHILYLQGRGGRPGRIVTNADGYKKLSNHQGGRAVDCTFLDDKGKAYYPSRSTTAGEAKWQAYGAEAKKLGLRWGGDFKSLKGGDAPHVEIPKEML